MGLIRPRTVVSMALDGRATFLVAGAVLGIGVYGFALTFKPYESGRVLQPFPALEPTVMSVEGPALEIPGGILPEGVQPMDVVVPAAPGEALVAVPRAAARSSEPVARPAPAVVEAASPAPSTPLDPVPAPPAPRELPPQEIAPENVLVYIYPHPTRGHDSDEARGGNQSSHSSRSRSGSPLTAGIRGTPDRAAP